MSSRILQPESAPWRGVPLLFPYLAKGAAKA
jgi:hypothetical protein